ncbi:MAG TPA: hypothetical protein VLT62_05890 [Candidatus Methylomirabilis sp.]|nr:hypothetical protein [Candidatus Methylomirabilis sp.]
MRTHELADFVEVAGRQYCLASDRIVAVGVPNGANIAASVLLLRPHVLAGAVLLRAMVPLVPAAKPNLCGGSVLLAAGRRDPTARPDETERLQELLVQAGADVMLHWEPAGHGLTPADIAVARSWLEDRAPARGDGPRGWAAKENRAN